LPSLPPRSTLFPYTTLFRSAGSLASDWYYLGRVRSFDEIQSAIDGLTPRGIIDHLNRCPPGGFTVVTLGPKPLQVNESTTREGEDRKSTRLNSSHVAISYAV